MNSNSYAGREYLKALNNAGLMVDVLNIGEFPEINSNEEDRCGGLWQPPKESYLERTFDFFHFQSLSDEKFISFLDEKKYDVCIQGGTGILKLNVIKKFTQGVLNFHPGNLPQYRGCSAPEWQLYENNDVYCTCHLIDEGIDTGNIYCAKKLDVSHDSYEHFRASVYPEVSKFVVEVVRKVILTKKIVCVPQDENLALYRKYIGLEKIAELRRRLDKRYLTINDL
jgi:methionyl-tRNA formyltransferase